MNKSMLEAGLYLIKMADSSAASTEALEKAIEDLKLTLHARQNLPF